MKRAMVLVTLLLAAGTAAANQTVGPDPVEIPLRLHGGLLIVPVMASNGSRLEFILSTGSTRPVFSEAGAARAGDPAGLTLNSLPIPTEGSVTVPDERLTAGGKVFDGIIGPTLLNQFDALIDVPGGKLVLKPIGRSVVWEGRAMSEPLRLRVYHGVVLGLDVSFNGLEYPAMLDLGMPTLVVNERVKIETEIAVEDTGTLTLGTTEFRDVPVRVRDLEVFRRWVPDGDGFVIVGASFTRDCAISISWVHRELRTCVP